MLDALWIDPRRLDRLLRETVPETPAPTTAANGDPPSDATGGCEACVGTVMPVVEGIASQPYTWWLF